MTLDRSRTVDEEISAKVIDFLDRHDPKKTGKPFFIWYNPARMNATKSAIGLPETKAIIHRERFASNYLTGYANLGNGSQAEVPVYLRSRVSQVG